MANASDTPIVTGPNFQQVPSAADLLVTVPTIQEAVPNSLGYALASGGTSPAALANAQNLTYNSSTGELTMTGVDGSKQFSVYINPTPPATIALYTPPWAVASVTDVVWTGTYTGAPPSSIDYTLDALNGSPTWVTVASSLTIINQATGGIQITLGTLSAAYYAAGNLAIRDTFATSVSGSAPGMWLVSSFNPAAPASASASLLFATQIANPLLVTLDTNGIPSYLKDYRNGSSQALYYNPSSPASTVGATYICTTPNSPKWNRADGSDGGQTCLDMSPVNNTIEGTFSTLYNWYTAGQKGGNNDALIEALDTGSNSTNSWVTVFACFVPNSTLNLFGCGPIWGDIITPGSSTGTNYVSVGRIHSNSYAAQYFAGLTAGTQYDWSASFTTPSNAWVVVTTQKIGTLFQTRIRTGETVTSFGTTTISGTGATSSYTSTNFTYGGGYPNGGEVGNAYQKLSDMFVIQGVPTAADIQGYEQLAGASIGIQMSASA